MSGKGSKPRPYSVSRDQFNSNWDKIFGSSDKDLAYESDNPLERPIEVHVHNDGHQILVQESVGEFWDAGGKRNAVIVKTVKGFAVEFYEKSKLIRTVNMFEHNLQYAEDAAENWCLGIH
jgi:hypothetical protein